MPIKLTVEAQFYREFEKHCPHALKRIEGVRELAKEMFLAGRKSNRKARQQGEARGAQ